MDRMTHGAATTLADVARHAGVSLATASRAINGSQKRVVNPQLAERVRQSAQLLGYAPDANAQAMARGASRAIGVAVHDLADPYFGAIAEGMAAAVAPRGNFLTLASTVNQLDRLDEVIAGLDSLRVRAIVLVGGQWKHSAATASLRLAIERYRARGGSVVCVGADVAGLDCVLVDNRGGSALLADRIQELGYRRPLVLTGPERHSTAAERAEGFIRRCRENAMPVPAHNRLASEFTRAGAQQAMRLAIESGLVFDVVVATNDVMAIGAMGEARRAGLDAPAAMAFAGFGDISLAEDMLPQLTTVHVPATLMGERAISLALEGPGDGSGTERMSVDVMVRGSTPRREHP